MASRLIALTAVVSLLAGIVQFPLHAVAATAAATASEHSHHHCCPKLEQTQLPAVTPVSPGLPCGADHSCCVVRAPAKLPSVPAGSRGEADRQLAHTIEPSLPIPLQAVEAAHIRFILVRSPLDLTTVLRI
jgi:hypothetical protein